MLDSELKDKSYVKSFGFEWTEIDGFVGKESMLHGHIFGRFLLPKNFHDEKTVVDVGCGNGRIGRLVAPLAKNYIGLDLSDSVYVSELLEAKNIIVSGTNLPLNVGDVTICWGTSSHG